MTANNPRCLLRCTECEHTQFERRSVVERRNIHCKWCGGMLQISKAAGEDLVRGMDRGREDAVRNETNVDYRML